MVVGTEEGDVLVLAGENDRPMELRKTLQAVHEMAPGRATDLIITSG
jgi:hypothetical protein